MSFIKAMKQLGAIIKGAVKGLLLWPVLIINFIPYTLYTVYHRRALLAHVDTCIKERRAVYDPLNSNNEIKIDKQGNCADYQLIYGYDPYTEWALQNIHHLVARTLPNSTESIYYALGIDKNYSLSLIETYPDDVKRDQNQQSLLNLQRQESTELGVLHSRIRWR